jgi:hypothetical protein
MYMTFRTVTSFLGIAIVLVYATGSGLWVNTGAGWYGRIALNYSSV